MPHLTKSKSPQSQLLLSNRFFQTTTFIQPVPYINILDVGLVIEQTAGRPRKTFVVGKTGERPSESFDILSIETFGGDAHMASPVAPLSPSRQENNVNYAPIPPEHALHSIIVLHLSWKWCLFQTTCQATQRLMLRFLID